MAKHKKPRYRSLEALAALLRGGAGKHPDRRTRRNRTRADQKKRAIRDHDA